MYYWACLQVYKLAQQDAALMSESHKAISYKLMFQAKLAKGWKLSKAENRAIRGFES